MSLGLLEYDERLPDDIRAALKEIEGEARRAANLTRQLLQFSRRQAMKLGPLDLNAVLDNLLKMLRRLLGEQVELEFCGKTGLPCVEADTGMIEQVVVNLCVNARDAMPQGGKLTIKTELVELDETAILAQPESRPGRFVSLVMADNGCGMDEATQKHMFEPFFTTKDVGKGTGLGLATVYGIVKQHKGWAEVQSSIGVGTTFRIFLPAIEATTPSPSAQKQSSPPQRGQETILLAEDDPTVRKLIGASLRRNGYTVLEATNGKEALVLWRQHQQSIQLLFSDMVMPEGLNGLELARQLRQANPHLKVLISSGYSVETSQLEAADGNWITYLPKPFELYDLAAEVRKCLDRPAQLGPPLKELNSRQVDSPRLA